MADNASKNTSNLELKLNKDEKIEKLEAELKEIKNKFNEAESIAKFGFWELDPVSLDRTWTDGLYKIVGYDPKSEDLTHYNDNKKIIHPDDWDYFYDATQTVFNTGKDLEFDVRVLRSDGSERIFNIIAKPKNDENGKVMGVRGTAQDITELKRMEKELADSERRYRYIVEKATAGMFILDNEGVIKYLNEHMAQTLDYSKNEMLERYIKDFVGENGNFCRYRKPVDTKIERYNWFKFLKKNGNVFWSNLTISPIFNSKKEYTGCLGIVTDINMQKGIEEAFLEREEIFTDIIYDMIEMLNSVAKDKNKSSDLSLKKNLNNN